MLLLLLLQTAIVHVLMITRIVVDLSTTAGAGAADVVTTAACSAIGVRRVIHRRTRSKAKRLIKAFDCAKSLGKHRRRQLIDSVRLRCWCWGRLLHVTELVLDMMSLWA